MKNVVIGNWNSILITWTVFTKVGQDKATRWLSNMVIYFFSLEDKYYVREASHPHAKE